MIIENKKIFKDTVIIPFGEGCLHHCSYCTFKNQYPQKYWCAKTNEIVKIMDKYNDYYGTNTFILQQELFFNKMKEISSFCEKLKERPNYKWACSVRIDYLTEDIISLISKRGCQSLFIGIETGSQKIQRKMKKNLNLAKVLETVEILAKYNINAIFSFIYKYPEENIFDLLQTVKLIYDIKQIEFKVKRSIFFIELSKITFFPNSEITLKYFNALKYDPYRNSEVASFPKDVRDFIRNNKVLLSDYFNLEDNINEYIERFEEFFIYLFNNYIYYKESHVDFLLKKYDYDILRLYRQVYQGEKEKMYLLLDMEKKNKLKNTHLKIKLCDEILSKY